TINPGDWRNASTVSAAQTTRSRPGRNAVRAVAAVRRSTTEVARRSAPASGTADGFAGMLPPRGGGRARASRDYTPAGTGPVRRLRSWPMVGGSAALREVQRDWAVLGEADPLWAVLVAPEARRGRWDPDEFFSTGRADVAQTVAWLGEIGRPNRWQRAL